MIDLNQPPVRADGVVLFGDDQRPPVWHVVPERPALDRLENGRPGCLLIKYRLDPSRDWPRGGGLLHLKANLRIANQALAIAREHLVARDRDIQNIVFLRPDRVTCELLLWTGETAGSSVVAATPSAEPPHDVSFHVPLSIEAVMLFEQALTAGHSPATLVYRMTVAARRPRLPAKATIDWRRTLEAFREQRGAQPGSAEEMAAAVRPLVERGEIRVEIGGDDDHVGIQERVIEELSHVVATRLRSSARETTTETIDFAQLREEEMVVTSTATITQLLEGLGPNGRAESLVTLMEEVSHG